MSLKITIEEVEEEEKLPSAKELAMKRKAMKMMAKMHGKKHRNCSKKWVWEIDPLTTQLNFPEANSSGYRLPERLPMNQKSYLQMNQPEILTRKQVK